MTSKQTMVKRHSTTLVPKAYFYKHLTKKKDYVKQKQRTTIFFFFYQIKRDTRPAPKYIEVDLYKIVKKGSERQCKKNVIS